EQPSAWHAAHCKRTRSGWALTVASVWYAGQRLRLIRRQDGFYLRMTSRDRAEVEKLLPEWRMIWADRGLNQDASLERKGLLSELIDVLLAQSHGSNNIRAQMSALMREMATLAERPAEEETLLSGWGPVVALE